MEDRPKLLVIGGGAAGFFGAIAAAEKNPGMAVEILEGSAKVLSKVLVSGGGRCNVTHACWEPKELVKHYPRGSKALLGPFHKFCTGDTYGWFEDRGVPLKIEEDNRVFPVSDQSSSIAEALETAVRKAGVVVTLNARVTQIEYRPDAAFNWEVSLANGQKKEADALLVATGGTPAMWDLMANLGHRIVAPVPSLFTFNIKDPRLEGLPGLSVPNARLKVKECDLEASGPLLITHWGLSGPAILRLSAWGARKLADCNYQFTLEVDWTGKGQLAKAEEEIKNFRKSVPRKLVHTANPFGMPNRWWETAARVAGAGPETKWADASNALLGQLLDGTVRAQYKVNGKSTFKEEFVTAGGIHLDEVDFRLFESKVCRNLFFAGEMLDIDAITGGFNFQAAWTGGWIAGTSIAERFAQ